MRGERSGSDEVWGDVGYGGFLGTDDSSGSADEPLRRPAGAEWGHN